MATQRSPDIACFNVAGRTRPRLSPSAFRPGYVDPVPPKSLHPDLAWGHVPNCPISRVFWNMALEPLGEKSVRCIGPVEGMAAPVTRGPRLIHNSFSPLQSPVHG